jgi:protein-L-isoaspartate(D-aspartate) O-methyltransferase
MVAARSAGDDLDRLRELLLEEIEADVRATSQLLGKQALDARVMAALATVPRHAFVPPGDESFAYFNRPFGIGYGQTISQPYIVAVMTDLLELHGGEVVLEVGTGSGYQTAILSGLVKHVYSIEVIPELAKSAAERLERLGYGNVEVRSGDGARGWPEHAPFDGIIVTAAAPKIPPALVDQLAPGRRLVIPVGSERWGQNLKLVEKRAAGEAETRTILPVAFVPLTEGR